MKRPRLTTAWVRDQFAAYEDPRFKDSDYEQNCKDFDEWLANHDAAILSFECGRLARTDKPE